MAPRASALKVTMRIALLGGALAATLVASVSAAADFHDSDLPRRARSRRQVRHARAHL